MASSSDGQVAMWDAGTWERYPLPAESGWPAFTLEGELFVSRTSDPAALLVWEVGTAALRHTLTHAAAVDGFVLSPAGDTVAVRIEDGSIWLWDIQRGEFLRSLDDYLTWDNLDRIFSQDGSLICAEGDGNTIKIWSVADATLVDSVQLPAPPVWIGASPDLSTVWVETEVDYNSTVHLWHPGEEAVTTVDGYLGPSSPDGRLFVVNTWEEVDDGQERIFQQVAQIRAAPDGDVLQTIVDPGWPMDFSQDNSILFVQSEPCEGEGDCFSVSLYAVEDGRLLNELGGLDDYLISSVYQSEAGALLAALTRSGSLYVWGLP